MEESCRGLMPSKKYVNLFRLIKQINISEDMWLSIERSLLVREVGKSLFSDARLAVLPALLICWKRLGSDQMEAAVDEGLFNMAAAHDGWYATPATISQLEAELLGERLQGLLQDTETQPEDLQKVTRFMDMNSDLQMGLKPQLQRLWAVQGQQLQAPTDWSRVILQLCIFMSIIVVISCDSPISTPAMESLYSFIDSHYRTTMPLLTSPPGCDSCLRLTQKVSELEERISILCRIREDKKTLDHVLSLPRLNLEIRGTSVVLNPGPWLILLHSQSLGSNQEIVEGDALLVFPSPRDISSSQTGLQFLMRKNFLI
ncbi:hypothetical protein NHX12_000256 [Muraenolepis orangiensis]|uniref:Uncharacterized protein n=1 Tax=Muraenolepis orangiensis TaxID=630683 RepID=A0A9Q0I2D5_9TELE|nr:hypothetical protein NHX12_000256 [Muraenolepis orangiensis]